jgi:hypothetical protein
MALLVLSFFPLFLSLSPFFVVEKRRAQNRFLYLLLFCIFFFTYLLTPCASRWTSWRPYISWTIIQPFPTVWEVVLLRAQEEITQHKREYAFRKLREWWTKRYSTRASISSSSYRYTTHRERSTRRTAQFSVSCIRWGSGRDLILYFFLLSTLT